MPDPRKDPNYGFRIPQTSKTRGKGLNHGVHNIPANTINRAKATQPPLKLRSESERIAKEIKRQLHHSIIFYRPLVNSQPYLRSTQEIFKPLYKEVKYNELGILLQKLRSQLEKLWDAIPDGSKFEFNVTVGPQAGIRLGKAGAAEIKADATLVSFKVFSDSYQKTKGNLTATKQIGHYKYDMRSDKWENAEGVEMNSKLGLEASAGSFSIGQTRGYISTFNIFQDGDRDGKSFTESMANRGGVAGKLTQEFIYGLKGVRKFETGYTFEVKCIVGIEIKLVNEKEIK